VFASHNYRIFFYPTVAPGLPMVLNSRPPVNWASRIMYIHFIHTITTYKFAYWPSQIAGGTTRTYEWISNWIGFWAMRPSGTAVTNGSHFCLSTLSAEVISQYCVRCRPPAYHFPVKKMVQHSSFVFLLLCAI